ncbi:MAG TPA: JAB domain-containing protein, partial [Flavisolibacter sp.]|nr:JAB domain-containing protein [Flavisolibacter sp.]
MEKLLDVSGEAKVSEIDLVYKSKIKASERPTISSSQDAYNLFRVLWEEGKIDFIEQFKMLLLNRANKVLCQFNVSSGGVTGTIADPRLIFIAALRVNAVAIIVAHNHPSGNLKPSQADQEFTLKIKAAGC